MTTKTLDALQPDKIVNEKKLPQEPDGCILLGNLRQFQRDPLGFIQGINRDYGDIAGFRFGNLRFYSLANPDHIQHVLTRNAANYRKPDRYETLKRVLGEGLVTSEGDFWKRQRRIAQPVFHRHRISTFIETMVECTQAMLLGWQQNADSGEPIDVAREMMKLTLRIAGKTMFSVDLLGDAEELGKSITIAIEHANLGFQSLFLMPEFLPTPENRRFKKAMKVLDGMVFEMIEQRRSEAGGTEDLLQMLLEARDEETGEGMTDQQLRDEVMTLLLAGHETTANALAWTFYLASVYPEALQGIRSEADEVLGGRDPQADDLSRLTWTSQVIHESMRIYPPVWTFNRQAIEDDEIDGLTIPQGSNLFCAPWVVHRNPAHWENPEAFDPHRFEPDRVKARHKLAYIPFAAGRRKCIGVDFALTELAVIVPMVLRELDLHLLPGHRVQPEPTVTLRPEGGLPMTIHRR